VVSISQNMKAIQVMIFISTCVVIDGN